MNKKLFIRNIFIVLALLLFVIFTSSLCYALEDGQIPSSYEQDVSNWLNNKGNNAGTVMRYAYGEGKTAYAIIMPTPKGNSNVEADNSGRYHYKYDTDNYNVDITLDVSTTIRFNTGGKYPALDETVIESNQIVTTKDNNQCVIPNVDYQDGKVNIRDSNGNIVASITEDEFEQYLSFDHNVSYTSDNVRQTTKTDETQETPATPPPTPTPPQSDGPITETFTPTKIKTKRVGIVDWLKNILETIKDYLKDILSRIFSFILLGIADGLKKLIDYAVGENVTLASIIFNHTKKMTIDYWSIPQVSAEQSASLVGDSMLLQTSIAGIMKPVVSYWFTRLRGIAILCYFVMLLYLGIKILLASTAMNLESTKERLVVWISGLLVLFMFPYLMKYSVHINNAVIKAIENKGVHTTQVTIEEEDATTNDTMTNVRSAAGANHSVPLAIVYIIMLGQLMALIFVYYKRAFMVGFLITIFPVICVKHLFDGINSGGKGRALGLWTKEYLVLVFTQLVHAVVYAVLIEGASNVFAFNNNTSGKGNVILYVLCVTFLFKAEQIVKDIFNVKSSAGLTGDMAGIGIAALTFGRQAVTGVGGLVSDGRSVADRNDLATEGKLTNKRRQLESSKNAQDIRDSRDRIKEGSNTAQTITDDTRRRTSEINDSGRTVITPESIRGGTTTTGIGGGTSGGSTSGLGTSGAPNLPNNLGENIDKAKTVLGEKGIKTRNRGAVRKTIKGVTGFAVKASAATVGAAAGLATGNVTNALTYGLAASAAAGTISKGIGKGVDFADRHFKATAKSVVIRNQLKNPNSKLNKELQSAGVDTDELLNNQKSELIRKALTQYYSGMITGGASEAKNNFDHEIISEEMKNLGKEIKRNTKKE